MEMFVGPIDSAMQLHLNLIAIMKPVRAQNGHSA